MKVVEVVWLDIECSAPGWMTQDEADEFITNAKNRTVTHVAYLYEEDEDQVVLTDSYTADAFGTFNVIPRGCIKSMEVLKS
jgi:hypothetical protein